MSEQPTVPGTEAIANKQAEQPTAPREQAAASDSQVPTEDFEAGVLAQLDSLYRTALRLTNNQQEAEDLVQETMLKAFRFANTYQRGTNLRAWLFRILNTSAINPTKSLPARSTTMNFDPSGSSTASTASASPVSRWSAVKFPEVF